MIWYKEQDKKEIVAPMQYKGTTDSRLFEYWFEHCLLPCLKKDTVIVMDNASFHRKNRLFQIADKFKFQLIFLPPYSPELNPIEKFWSRLKRSISSNLHLFTSLNLPISHAFLPSCPRCTLLKSFYYNNPVTGSK